MCVIISLIYKLKKIDSYSFSDYEQKQQDYFLTAKEETNVCMHRCLIRVESCAFYQWRL